MLSQAPADWDKLRQKVRKLRFTLAAKDGLKCDLAWTVERNPKGTGFHIHALQKGDYIPQPLLQDRWGHVVHIQKIRTDPQKVASYATKEALRVAGYTVKGSTGSPASIATHLRLNGGRIVHVGKGYLGEWTQEETWKALRGPLEPGWMLVTA